MSRSEGIYYDDGYKVLCYDGLIAMLEDLPKDGREYYWSINYEQWIAVLKLRGNNELWIVQQTYTEDGIKFFMFGLSVKIDNLPEPISLQPVDYDIEKTNNYWIKSTKRVNRVDWKEE